MLHWGLMAMQSLLQPILASSLCRLAALLALCLAHGSLANAAESSAGLLVSIDAQGRLNSLEMEETPFEARLDYGSDQVAVQAWHYNIYAQFYFPGEDPRIDYTFLGNRSYPRLLLKLDRQAALIWVNTATNRAEARKIRDELRRQGLEGAFVARVRGDYGYEHTAAQQAALELLAGKLDAQQCGKLSPLEWLSRQDLRRRYALRVRLLYVDGIQGINQALELRTSLAAELGECGMLNGPGGGYRLFCGAYGDAEELRSAYAQVHALSGLEPTVVCLNADGLETRWIEEDLSDPLR